MEDQNFIKGQGAQQNVTNRFDRYTLEPEDHPDTVKTSFTEILLIKSKARIFLLNIP